MVQQQNWTNFSLQRPNYFPGQYLLDKDFELAHKYLSDRQRYINSRLHLAGIVEGLEVEVVPSQAEVIIKAGTAIDGEGNLIILSKAASRKIIKSGWLCLHYNHEPQELQQPEIPDSFTRLVEKPLLELKDLEIRDSKTVILAQVKLNGQDITIDSSVRHYSGVRLPSSSDDTITLQNQGGALAVQGDLHLAGALQLNNSTLSAISDQIEPNIDRTTVVPSEKAVKEHLEKRLLERLSTLSLPNGGDPLLAAGSMIVRVNNGLNNWQITQETAANKTAMLQILSKQGEVEKPRLIIERDSGNVGIDTLTPSRSLDVNGNIRAKHIESSNPMRHRMYPNNPIIYQDIFEAVRQEAIKAHKNPRGYTNTAHTANNKYCDRPAICFGEQTVDDSGALITVPEGYDTIWVRVLSDGWYRLKAQFLDRSKEDLGYWTAGRRNANCYCPDGSLSDGYHERHQWLPIPVGRAGTVLLIDGVTRYGNMRGMWFSGLGFSKNPWAHATQSGLGYHWAVNGGNEIGWESENLSGDIVVQIVRGTNVEMMVPYVWSGRDKLLYIAEWNYGNNGCAHSSVTVNDKPVGRLLASYNNPFARHWNSKTNNRYIAARIPASLIPKPTAETPPLLRVKIDMTLQNEDLHFREMGTHDLDVPEWL